jgi:D-beta-D-heptose 7-phosphate kinase/D-beta-D-heptose 1-phosphate adenosyltransferase
MMEAREMAAALGRMARSSVLVVGDVMLDEYVWGEVARISPEAPIPVVDVKTRSRAAGGAANAAACVAALGARATLVGVVGEDPEGQVLASMLKGGSVDARLVPSSRPTTVKTRIIARSQQVVRVDSEDRTPLDPGVESQILDGVRSALGGADAVVISDYAKGLVSPAVASAVIEAARQASTPVVVDPKGSDFAKYRGAAVITPNVSEARQAAGIQDEDGADLSEVAERLRAVVGDSALLITRGGEGMSLFTDSSPRIDIPASSRDVYDPTGAGDAVVAAVGLAVAQGISLPVAAELSNAAGGVVVEKLGTAVVSREELEGAVEEHPAE